MWGCAAVSDACAEEEPDACAPLHMFACSMPPATSAEQRDRRCFAVLWCLALPLWANLVHRGLHSGRADMR